MLINLEKPHNFEFGEFPPLFHLFPVVKKKQSFWCILTMRQSLSLLENADGDPAFQVFFIPTRIIMHGEHL